MTKKSLITGGAGFIGSHLAENLLKHNHEVWVVDNLSGSASHNIRHLLKNRNFHFVKGTILDERLMMRVMKKTSRIWHLAATMGVKRIIEKPLDSFVNNIDGTKMILSMASRKKIPVLIASSSEIYGKNPHLPFEEEADRVYGAVESPRWGYALAKAVNEFLALTYSRQRKFPCIVVRFFNVIGPRQTAAQGMVAPTFIQQALSGRPITVYGEGSQTRCFIDVEDVVSALISLMETPKAFGEVLDLGSQEEIRIIDLARLIKKLTKSKSRIIRIPYRKAYGPKFEDVTRSKPRLIKIKKLIHFEPKFTLEESLKKIINFHLLKNY